MVSAEDENMKKRHSLTVRTCRSQHSLIYYHSAVRVEIRSLNMDVEERECGWTRIVLVFPYWARDWPVVVLHLHAGS